MNKINSIKILLSVIFVKKSFYLLTKDAETMTTLLENIVVQPITIAICFIELTQKTIKIPCIIHNLKGYDSHLILNAVKPHHGDISVIPTNTEKYISFSIGNITFIDSNQFMLSKLEKLVENLDDNKFYETRKYLEMGYGGKKLLLCFYINVEEKINRRYISEKNNFYM